MIVVTGAAGFIGSCLIHKLNQEGFKAIIAVDDFSSPEKTANLRGLVIQEKVHRDQFINWIEENQQILEFIFHIGARTDTTEFDKALLWKLNTDYTKEVWNACVKHQIPLVYASSAATYGLGEKGYDDDEGIIDSLKPLNPYGESKNAFDSWAIKQDQKPFFWAGLKFFNVYGPNEYHKGRMASVIFHAFHQIQETGKMNLFRSHRSDYADGEQKRDFIYVTDVVNVCFYLMHHRKHSGIYNLGSGRARTFNDLTTAVFSALHLAPNIHYIDTPEDIRDTYQYYTEANMNKLRSIGYDRAFYPLEEGVKEYMTRYLKPGKYYQEA